MNKVVTFKDHGKTVRTVMAPKDSPSCVIHSQAWSTIQKAKDDEVITFIDVQGITWNVMKRKGLALAESKNGTVLTFLAPGTKLRRSEQTDIEDMGLSMDIHKSPTMDLFKTKRRIQVLYDKVFGEGSYAKIKVPEKVKKSKQREDIGIGKEDLMSSEAHYRYTYAKKKLAGYAGQDLGSHYGSAIAAGVEKKLKTKKSEEPQRLEKARQRAGLVKKTITNKAGRRQTVWVDPEKGKAKPGSGKAKAGESETDWPGVSRAKYDAMVSELSAMKAGTTRSVQGLVVTRTQRGFSISATERGRKVTPKTANDAVGYILDQASKARKVKPGSAEARASKLEYDIKTQPGGTRGKIMRVRAKLANAKVALKRAQSDKRMSKNKLKRLENEVQIYQKNLDRLMKETMREQKPERRARRAEYEQDYGKPALKGVPSSSSEKSEKEDFVKGQRRQQRQRNQTCKYCSKPATKRLTLPNDKEILVCDKCAKRVKSRVRVKDNCSLTKKGILAWALDPVQITINGKPATLYKQK